MTKLFSDEESWLRFAHCWAGATMRERQQGEILLALARQAPVEINFAACPLNNFYRSWLEWVRRMIRLIASPARSGFYSRLFYFTAPAFWERALKKNYFWFVCCCSGQDSALWNPLNCGNTVCRTFCTHKSAEAKQHEKYVCVGFIRLLCVKGARPHKVYTHWCCERASAFSQRSSSWFYLGAIFHSIMLRILQILELSYPAFCS